MVKKQKQSQWEIFWAPLTNALKTFNIKANKKLTRSAKLFYAFLLVMAVLMPLIGWSVGAAQNPDGWMSDSPFIGYFHLFLYAMHLWYVVVGFLIIGILVFKAIGAKEPLIHRCCTIGIFILSLIYSIFLMTLVRDASRDEFTG